MMRHEVTHLPASLKSLDMPSELPGSDRCIVEKEEMVAW